LDFIKHAAIENVITGPPKVTIGAAKETLRFLCIERPGSNPSKNGDLITAFVYCSVAIDPSANC
jgi:hypothetical protein